ncbi:MAG: DUF4019 domain-containing protein, partial [Candidatus Sulfotelmatobacter sp.]
MNIEWRKFQSTVAVFSLSMLLLAVCPVVQAQQKSEQLARQSAESWLALVDSGKYGESWEQASQFFKAAVTKEQWQSA